jgi:hypothetical protein
LISLMVEATTVPGSTTPKSAPGGSATMGQGGVCGWEGWAAAGGLAGVRPWAGAAGCWAKAPLLGARLRQVPTRIAETR